MLDVGTGGGDIPFSLVRWAEKRGKRVSVTAIDLNEHCRAYAGQLGYGPNPKLQQRVRDADLLLVVGARLGEATTDGYQLITPDHPGQTLVHVHPDPSELGKVFRTDIGKRAFQTAKSS